jgi:hypothetical protein
LRYRTAILRVKAVIKLQIDQFAPATALTTFGELMAICDSVNRESQYHKELHKVKLAI